MTVYSVMIINSSGSLVYFDSYSNMGPKLYENDEEIIASTLSCLHTHSVQASPVEKSSGFSEIDFKTWKLHFFQSVTGLKILLFCTSDTNREKMKTLLKDIYREYSNYALKNPFYVLGQLVKSTCEKFSDSVIQIIHEANR